MFQGPYALNPGPFWMAIHPITVLLMTVALILNWRGPRRRPILLVLGGYVLVLAITFAYFVPVLLGIIATPYADVVDPAMRASAARWEVLSIVRLVFLMVLAVVLLGALARPAELADPRTAT
jgi:hypothetical protein